MNKSILKFSSFYIALMISSNTWAASEERFGYPNTPRTPMTPLAYSLDSDDTLLSGKRGEKPEWFEDQEEKKRQKTKKKSLSHEQMQEIAQTAVDQKLVYFKGTHWTNKSTIIWVNYWRNSTEYGLFCVHYPHLKPSQSEVNKIRELAAQLLKKNNENYQETEQRRQEALRLQEQQRQEAEQRRQEALRLQEQQRQEALRLQEQQRQEALRQMVNANFRDDRLSTGDQELIQRVKFSILEDKGFKNAIIAFDILDSAYDNEILSTERNTLKKDWHKDLNFTDKYKMNGNQLGGIAQQIRKKICEQREIIESE